MLGEQAGARRWGGAVIERASARSLVVARLPLLLALAVVAAVGLPTLNFAYGPDQALFVYMGDAIAHGKRLYVDVWDVKPPGVFWVYAVAAQLPGGFRGLRAFDLAYALAIVIAIDALGRQWWGRAVGAVAGALFGVVYVTASGYWNMAQPDNYMLLPVVLGVLTWERGVGTRTTRPALATGLLFGFALQFRSVVLVLPAVLVLFDLLHRDRRLGVMRRTALLALGGAIVQALTMLSLLPGGGLGEYLFAQFRFARHYAALGGPYAYDAFTFTGYLGGLRGSLMWFFVSRLLLTAPALAALFVGGALRGDRAVRLAGSLLLAGVATVAIQAKFFIYHWHIVLPFLALLAAWMLVAAWTALRARHRVTLAAAQGATALALLLFFTPQVSDTGTREWVDLVRFVREPAFRTPYYDRFGLMGHGSYSFRASEIVANYVRARSQPGDTVFVWGYDPTLYVLSDRASASRFTSLLPLMPTFTPPAWQEEFIRDLNEQQPLYILAQRGENARWITGRVEDSYEWIRDFDAFSDILDRDYVFDQRIEDYFIFRRR